MNNMLSSSMGPKMNGGTTDTLVVASLSPERL